METRQNQLIYNRSFQIRSYELSVDQRLTVATMCNFLQETASNHADTLKVGYKELIEQGIFWVLSELSVSVLSPLPTLYDSLEVKTWPTGFDRYFAYRDFEIMANDSNLVATATTKWMLVNVESRKPSPVPAWMKERLPLDTIKGTKTARYNLKTPAAEKLFQVRYSDLDINLHVNNVKMIEWILESVPEFLESNHVLQRIDLTFRAEARYKENISLQSCSINDRQSIYHHQLLIPQRNQIITTARTHWKV